MMGIRSFLKNTVKQNTNIKGWAAWDLIKNNGKIVANFARDLKNESKENADAIPTTFEDAVAQYHLTEHDIQRAKKTHLMVAMVCAALGLGALGWTVHLVLKDMLLSGLVSLSLSAMMFAYAFREHFHYFQLKQKRLDCSVQEWTKSFFSKKSHS